MIAPSLQPTPKLPLRLYLDESGDHTICSDVNAGIGKRYLGVVGVIFQRDSRYQAFADAMTAFKKKHLAYDSDDPPILHRSDILQARYPFGVLRDPLRRQSFDDDLVALIESAQCLVISVVIDKVDHYARDYRELTHPYHYCMHAMLERYCGLLKHKNMAGDVIAEGRAGAEDTALKKLFRSIWASGTPYMKPDLCQATLTSKEIKLKTKEANHAGLQLADIIAHTATRLVLGEYGRSSEMGGPFGERLAPIISRKLNRHLSRGRTRGYGLVLL